MALLEARCALEATQRMTDADLRELQRMHDELERTAAESDVDGYYKANHVLPQLRAARRWQSLPRSRHGGLAQICAPSAWPSARVAGPY